MKSAFSATGSMYFLAVSGLHVGIIYLFLAFLFPFRENRKLAFLNLFVILTLLWAYALLCGMSISVVRAVLMLSFVTVAKYLNKNSNVINTILLSAFILLLVYPYNLFDVGFQLSYLAVLGIVLLYPKSYSFLTPRFVFTRWVWKVVCLSLSAQIATVGLSVYYFHQFPNYFLLSNLLLFPLVPIVLFSGILFFAFSWVPFINDIFFYVLKSSIWLFNRVVFEVEKLPFSLGDFLYLEKLDLLLIY
jgi:competence protein ComEC